MERPAQLIETRPLPIQALQPNDSIPATPTRQLRRFALATAILVLCFAYPLIELVRFAAASELYSYILLVPLISGYLVWLKRRNLPVSAQPARPAAFVFLLAGLALAAAHWLWFRSSFLRVRDNHLAVMTICFLLFFVGVCCLFWGTKTLRAAAFPLGFLIFMAPLPPAAVHGIDSFLQKGSAVAAADFFRISGTPFLQNGLSFQLPGASLEIAPECSGIHSTLVLFITSLLGGYLFLQTPWKRALFILFVIPLALIRNGFRIFVIGQLCVYIGPQMLYSPIHRRGGPLFFALSLIPLFLLLILLHKSERATGIADSKTPKISHA